MTNIIDRKRRLKVIYDRLPTVECKGLCHEACGPIMMTDLEAGLVERALGQPLDHDPKTITCDALGPDRRCLVYANRPLVCRLYGVARRLRCDFGCEPTRVMEDAEVADVLKKIDNL